MRGEPNTSRSTGVRTFTPDCNTPKPYVIYHSPCPDGFGAAYAAWRYFGDEARYIGLNYSDAAPELRAGADVYMLDFSFSAAIIEELATRHPKVVVVDHHKGSNVELQKVTAPNVEIVFDNDHSGAYLAWKYFHPEASMPVLIPYIEDGDLYTWKLYQSRQINEALRTYPMSFDVWHDLMTGESLGALAREGYGIRRYIESRMLSLCNDARAANIGGHIVPVVNAPYFLASELGNYLVNKYPKAPFAATYRDRGDGRRDWSLRSLDDRLDVNAVAREIGIGGGHRNAAGMSEQWHRQHVNFVPLTRPEKDELWG